MKRVSMVELRTNFEDVVKALRQGVRVLLTYRGRELAHIEPVRKPRPAGGIDPLWRVAENAVPSPLGPLDHGSIDTDVYGQQKNLC